MAEQRSMKLLKQNESYRSWFAADTSGEIAQQVVFAALTLLAYSVTEDVAQTGFIAAAMAASRFASMLAGSWIVDFYPKRRLMIINALCRIVVSTVLLMLLSVGSLNTLSMFCISIAYGIIGGVFGNLTNAILPFIVAKDDISAALTANETRDSVIQIAAAPASALLFTAARALPFIIDILGFAILAIATRSIRGDLEAKPVEDQENSAGGALRIFYERSSRGLRWVYRQPAVLSVLLLMTISSSSSFLVINATELHILDSGQPVWRVGVVFAFFSAGMVCGGLLAAPLRRRLNPRRIVVLSAVVDVIAMVAFITANHWVLLAVIMFLWTQLVIVNNSVLGAFQISKTPMDLHGRVGAAFRLIIGLTPIIGAGLAGILLSSLGWMLTMSIALGLAAIRLAFAVFSRNLGDLKPAESA